MKRLTVDVTDELNALLDKVAKDTGCSKSEVFRKAVTLIGASHEATREGKKIGVFSPDKKQLEEVFVNL